MYAKVQVIMKKHKAAAVQGRYSANGKTISLMDSIGEGETARGVRAAQWARAEKQLGVAPSE